MVVRREVRPSELPAGQLATRVAVQAARRAVRLVEQRGDPRVKHPAARLAAQRVGRLAARRAPPRVGRLAARGAATGGSAGGAGGNPNALEAGCYSSGTTHRFPTAQTGSLSAEEFCSLFEAGCNPSLSQNADALAGCRADYEAATTNRNCQSYYVCNATAYAAGVANCSAAAGSPPCR